MMKKRSVTLSLIALLSAGGMMLGLASCGGGNEGSVETPTSEKTSTPAEEKTVTKIEVATNPTKTEYEEGEKLDLTGMKVNAVYSDESKEDVTSKCTTNLDGKDLVASNTNFFVIYKYTEGGKTKTKSVSVNITVKAEEVIHPEVDLELEVSVDMLPHNVLKTTTADMVFWGYYDSTSMKNTSVLELNKDGDTAGTFKFTEQNGIDSGVEKLGIITGDYTIEGTRMILQSRQVRASKTAKYSGATKEIVQITKEGDKITGLDFGGMSGSSTLWGWSKSKVASFVESGATKHGLGADVFYMEAVENHALAADMLDYYVVDTLALKEGAEMKTSYYVGDKFDRTNLAAVVNYRVPEGSANTNMLDLVLTHNLVVDTDKALTEADTSMEVSYDGAKFDIPITVLPVPVEKQVKGIQVKTNPTKMDYLIGEKFDKAGMVVEAVYTDESTEVIEDYKLNDIQLTPNNKTIVVTSADDAFTTRFDVNVSFSEPWQVAQTSTEDQIYFGNGTISGNKAQYECLELNGSATAGTFICTIRFTTQKYTSGNNYFVYRGDYTATDTAIRMIPTFIYTDKATTAMYYNPAKTGSLKEGSAFEASFVKEDGAVTGITFAATSETDKYINTSGAELPVACFFNCNATATPVEVHMDKVIDNTLSSTILDNIPDALK